MSVYEDTASIGYLGLVWCHLPSWAIWSPSLRPQFSPARLSGLRTRDNYQKLSIRISTSISNLNLQFVIKRKSTCSTSILVTGLSPAHLDFISLQYGVASIGIWKWEFCTFKKEVSHWMVHGYHECHYILRGFHCECKKTEAKWYFSSSPSPSYWRMGPELTRLAGVPISLGLAEDQLDANLQELVIRPRSY